MFNGKNCVEIKYIFLIGLVIAAIYFNYTTESPLTEREMVEIAINNTDKEVMAHISFINVTTKNEVIEKCRKDSVVGCTITRTISDDENVYISTSRIYIANKEALKPTCNSFENLLYHEIGHVVFQYQRNFNITDEDDAAAEQFADEYANRYAKNKPCFFEQNPKH